MDGATHPLCNRRSTRLLLGLAILVGWLVIGSYRFSLAGPQLQEDGQAYIVQSGDSLTHISASFYGDATRWPEIFEATNAKAREDSSFATVNNPRLIYPGQKLWIPALPPAEEEDREPAQPQAADSASTSEPNAITATQTLSNTLLAAVRQLVGEANQAGSLADAQSQVQLAREHLGFLQEALDQNDLTLTWRHAEHVVNILEGEDGVLFGDNDRDGQTQNPGNGVGVDAYLTDVQAQAQIALGALDGAATNPAIGLSVRQLVTSTINSQGLAQAIVDQAFQIFAADSVGEIQPIADALALQLNELQETIANISTTAMQLLALSDEVAGQSGDAGDAVLLPLRELFAEEGGVLVNAQSQTQLAREHLGFLQEALVQNDLTLARRHAEHVVNILEGEAGVLFGDNDRDGQTQNPGDGVGVRAYLANAQTVLDTLDEGIVGGEGSVSVQQLRVAIVNSRELAQAAAAKAFQVFAADSAGETGIIVAELKGWLNELEMSLTNGMASGSRLFTTRVLPPTAENQILLPLRELFAEEGGVLANAQNQTQLAREHLGFLQEALVQNDLTLARRHAEHVVNILEGADGELFGDNDRDGQTQNPGDGVGVRAYLADAQTQAQAVLDALDEAALDTAIGISVQRFVASTTRGGNLTQETAAKALQIFAADTIRETRAIAVELELLLNELQDTIANTFTLGTELLQT